MCRKHLADFTSDLWVKAQQEKVEVMSSTQAVTMKLFYPRSERKEGETLDIQTLQVTKKKKNKKQQICQPKTCMFMFASISSHSVKSNTLRL